MARTTMADLITTVRQLTASGTADYTVGGTTYWTDDQVETVLDLYRTDVYEERIEPISSELDSDGTARYYDYQSAYTYYETTDAGTAVFTIRDSGGTVLGTATYTIDYDRGHIEFSSDTTGSARWINGRSYDVYAAAADIWNRKAGHVADRFDFTADGASFKVSQLVDHYKMQAGEAQKQATTFGVKSTTMYRDDVTLP